MSIKHTHKFGANIIKSANFEVFAGKVKIRQKCTTKFMFNLDNNIQKSENWPFLFDFAFWASICGTVGNSRAMLAI